MLGCYLVTALISIFAAILIINCRARVQKQQKTAELLCKTKMIFRDHIYLTRMYIIAILNNLSENQAIAQRLAVNQKEIGNLFINYGDTVVQNMTNLWNQHTEIASSIILAYKEKRTTDVPKLISDWKQNGLDIANFLCKLLDLHQSQLSSENANVCVSNVQSMIVQHLLIVIDELNSIIQNEFQASLIALDQALAQSDAMAFWITEMLL